MSDKLLRDQGKRLHDWDNPTSILRQCLECGLADQGFVNPSSPGCPGATYIPQEYPKMVPGPGGPTVVQDAADEASVLRSRLEMMEFCAQIQEPLAGEAAQILRNAIKKISSSYANEKAKYAKREALTFHNLEKALEKAAPSPIDVDAWNWARRTPSHDWIGALYRPYEPPV